MWIYIESERGLYTTGFYDPEGKFQGDRDFDNKEDAAARCNYLNGGLK